MRHNRARYDTNFNSWFSHVSQQYAPARAPTQCPCVSDAYWMRVGSLFDADRCLGLPLHAGAKGDAAEALVRGWAWYGLVLTQRFFFGATHGLQPGDTGEYQANKGTKHAWGTKQTKVPSPSSRVTPGAPLPRPGLLRSVYGNFDGR